MRKFIRKTTVAATLICVVLFLFVIIGQYRLPDAITQYDGNEVSLSSAFSLSKGEPVRSVDSQTNEKTQSTLRVFSLVPVKTVQITHKPSGKVYVSGEVFGIKLYTDGVIVVGTQEVDIGDGRKKNPAADAGIEVGDVIVAINQVNVYSAAEVRELLNDNNGRNYSVKLKRNGRYKTFTLTPAYAPREGCYKAGMWVRDSTAGIGTLTFYNQDSGMFAALGHQINDVDTNEIMPLLEGEAVAATITRVQKGTAGVTGSLYCDFNAYTIGRLTANEACGLYGAYASIPETAKCYTVATKQEVQKGEATLITTVEGTTPRAYTIEITRISFNRENEQKDIIFKVTDKDLLAKTGGIVQGMSGSPIIQNGKLVGAVTHVIVSHPEKGYAIFAETMVEKSAS